MKYSSEVEDAITAMRKDLPVRELEHLSSRGEDTPVSGDALAVYVWSETEKWFNSLSPLVQWQDLTEPERVGAREAYLEEREG